MYNFRASIPIVVKHVCNTRAHSCAQRARRGSARRRVIPLRGCSGSTCTVVRMRETGRSIRTRGCRGALEEIGESRPWRSPTNCNPPAGSATAARRELQIVKQEPPSARDGMIAWMSVPSQSDIPSLHSESLQEPAPTGGLAKTYTARGTGSDSRS